MMMLLLSSLLFFTKPLVVLDSNTGMPIEGCHILWESGELVGYTDKYGLVNIPITYSKRKLATQHILYKSTGFLPDFTTKQPDTIYLDLKINETSPVLVSPGSVKKQILVARDNAIEAYGKTALEIDACLKLKHLGVAPNSVHSLSGEVKLLFFNGIINSHPSLVYHSFNEDFGLSPFISPKIFDQTLVDLQTLSSLLWENWTDRLSPARMLNDLETYANGFDYSKDSVFENHPISIFSFRDTLETSIVEIQLHLAQATDEIVFYQESYLKKDGRESLLYKYHLEFSIQNGIFFPVLVESSNAMFESKANLSIHNSTANTLSGQRLGETTIVDLRRAVLSGGTVKDSWEQCPKEGGVHPAQSIEPFIQKIRSHLEERNGSHIDVTVKTSYPSEGKSFDKKYTVTTSPASQSLLIEDGKIKTTITPAHTYVEGLKKNQVLDYPFVDFGYYKHVDVRKAYFEPVTHPNMFVESLKAFLAQPNITQTLFPSTHQGEQCWTYQMAKPNTAENDSVLAKLFFRHSDSLPIGMDVYEHEHDILTQKSITYLPYQPFRADLSPKAKIKTVKVKGTAKKRLSENYKGEKVKGWKKKQKANRDGTNLSINNRKSIAGTEIEGKYTLLAYWFSSCYYCIQSMPTLEKMHKRMGYKDFQVLGVNPVDPDPIAVEGFLQKKGITYPNTMDADDLLDGYEPNAYPTYILLGKDGQVLDMQEGYNPKALERMVRKHVK